MMCMECARMCTVSALLFCAMACFSACNSTTKELSVHRIDDDSGAIEYTASEDGTYQVSVYSTDFTSRGSGVDSLLTTLRDFEIRVSYADSTRRITKDELMPENFAITPYGFASIYV